MTTKKYLILIIVVVVLIIIGATYFYLQEDKVSTTVGPDKVTRLDVDLEKETVEEPKKVRLTEEEIKENQEKIGGVIETGEFSACNQLKGDFKDLCEYNILMDQAVDKSDKTICEQINDENYRQGCISIIEENEKLGITPEVVKEEEKKGYEEEMKERVLSGSAYNNLMQAYDKGEVTEKLYGEFIKVVAFLEEPILCWELAQELRQECLERAYIIIAKRQDNTKVCEKIATPDWKADCYRQVLTKRALEQGDIEICFEIQDKSDQEACRNSF